MFAPKEGDDIVVVGIPVEGHSAMEDLEAECARINIREDDMKEEIEVASLPQSGSPNPFPEKVQEGFAGKLIYPRVLML